MSIAIIEGVTGAGKTSTIEALRAVSAFELIDEEATFDDFVTEFFADSNAAGGSAIIRMALSLTISGRR